MMHNPGPRMSPNLPYNKNSFEDIKKAFNGDIETAELLSKNEALILRFIQDFI